MNQTHTVTNILGHRLTVFRNDHVSDKIVRHGLYEKENLALLLKLLGAIAEPVVLDIGANIGNHTLAFATRASAVHAFEPIPRIHALLSSNVSDNNLSHVSVHNLALSDTAGSDTIYMVMDGNYGASSFDRRSEGVEPVTVNKVVGDSFLAELGVTRVDLIKIDVEAHEVFVLRGLLQTLQRDLPVITMEWNDPLTIERLNGSPELALLKENYSIHVLGSNYDRDWWTSKPLGPLRRRLTRLFNPRKAVLYPFDPTRLYKNLLLIPHGKEALLDRLEG